MPTEMGQGIEDGRKDCFFEALNPTNLQEPVIRDTCQYSIHFKGSLIQPAYQFFFRDWTALREFEGAIAGIRCAADAGTNPLFQVAAQVQEDIGDAVLRLVGSPPNLAVVQLLEAVFDPLHADGKAMAAGGDVGVADAVVVRRGLTHGWCSLAVGTLN